VEKIANSMKSKIGGLVLLLPATTVAVADATVPTIIPALVKAETPEANYRPGANEPTVKTAIHYGLVPKDKANPIMDKLLAKMNEVGYKNFAMGLPGNLIPVPNKDYLGYNGTNEDGSDGFQIYENGGATACFAYFTLAMLYDLGRIQDGDRILFPMLDSFARGDFQGFGANKKSKDWRTWNGECHGYEGLLNDNYYALLAVRDREAARKKNQDLLKFHKVGSQKHMIP
jgi:hypothetical protein